MNVRAMASAATARINPPVIGTVLISIGNAENPDGSQTPQYAAIRNVPFTVQALSTSDIMRIDNLNQEQTHRAVYLNGRASGVNRLLGQGGDILWFNDASWLVTQQLEPWDANGWTKVLVTQQNQ